MMRVDVKPEMLRWARERAGLDIDEVASAIPKYPEWESGDLQPAWGQLEKFASRVHVPFGYLFLSEPPVERLPIPDFRGLPKDRLGSFTPDLLDTVYLCQERQFWYRDYAISTGEDRKTFVGSIRTTTNPVRAADAIRREIGFDVQSRRKMSTWTDALREFIRLADARGILVMVSGVVGSNTHRKLSRDEFQGFALADDLAPLVFINGADTKAAQMFTLAHELAHIWIGSTALSDARARELPNHKVERWCNEVAAELLVPMSPFREEYDRDADLRSELNRLARVYKVSTLVILRRMYDAKGITRAQFWSTYDAEVKHLIEMMQKRREGKKGGGDFYLTLPVRVSRRFAHAVVANTLEGHTPFTEAYRLLGFKKTATFERLSQELGFRF